MSDLSVSPKCNAPLLRCSQGYDRLPFLTVSGGTPPYTFLWAEPGQFPMLDILVEYTKRPTGVLTLEPATQTVEWETANINTARVYVTGADGIRTLFAESPSGSEPASFMILGHPLHFELVGVEHNPYPEGPLLAMADYDGAGGTVSEVLPLCQRPGRNVLFVHGFPPGININSDGTITGTPWEFGEFIFYIIVTDALGQQVAGPYIMGITGP